MKKYLLFVLLSLLTLSAFRPVYSQPQIINVISQPVECYGEANGSLTIEISGGIPDYTYILYKGVDAVGYVETGATTYAFPGLSAGSYIISVEDSAGDGDSRFVSVTQPSLLTASISPNPAEICPDNDRQLNGNPVGGNGGYVHEWSGPGTSYLDDMSREDPLFRSATVGSYDLTYKVTDGKGCEASDFITVEVLTEISAGYTSSDVTCYGGSNGSVTVTGASGGSGLYEYMISGTGWQSSGIFGGLPEGYYDIYIRDANYPDDCVVSVGQAHVDQPDLMTASITHTNVTCFGGSDGSITISGATGGSGNYEYNVGGIGWKGDGLFENLAGGDYVVEIRDVADPSCVVILEGAYTVSQPAEMAAVISHTDVTCFGGSNGSITISGATGGSGTYEYNVGGIGWKGDGLFENLAAGAYVVEIRDAANPACVIIVDGAYTVSEPVLMTSSITHTEVTCFGGSNGSITISGAAGGSGTYEYNVGGIGWKADGLFDGLPAGNYVVEIRDVADPSCVVILDGAYTVSQPAEMTAVISHTDVTCFGGSNGSITISGAAGGSGTYEYNVGGLGWKADGLFENLVAGDYVVEIRDVADPSCVVILDGAYTVSQPDLMTASITHADVTCFGGSNGSINISGALGGSGTYEYNVGGIGWKADGLFAGLPAGNYVVEIRDVADPSCVVILDGAYTVSQPAELAAVISHTDVTCFGGSDGSITISGATGGSGSYEYNVGGIGWQSTDTFGGLLPGDYIVEMRDAADPACALLLSGSYTISEPAPLGAAVDSSDVAGCNGDATGWIEIINETGSWAAVTGNYEYTIDGGVTWSVISLFDNLPAGTYNVQVRDGDNPACFYIINDNLVLDQPDPITADLVAVDVTCYGGSDGSIEFVNVQGGSGFYQYTIIGPSTRQQTSPYFPNLTAGSYDVRIRNIVDPACPEIINAAFIIGQPDELTATVTKTDVTGCFGDSNGEFSITGATGGSGDFQYSIDNGNTWHNNNIFSDIGAGIYNVLLRDANEPGCFVELVGSPFEIIQPDELVVDVDLVHVDCHGNASGSISVTATGGNGNYEYRINGGAWQVDPLFGGLPAGDYLVELRDGMGCADSELVTITEPGALTFDNIVSNDETCFEFKDGDIEIFVSGGTLPYRYSIDGGTTFHDTSYFDNLEPGLYPLSVEDGAGCILSYPVSIRIEAAPEIVVSQLDITDVSCIGSADGEVIITATGGTGEILYSIDGTTFSSVNTFSGLAAGGYTIWMEDSRSCINSVDLTIGQPEELLITARVLNTECHDVTGDPEIAAMATGGTAPYTFSLFRGGTLVESFPGINEGVEVLFELLDAEVTDYEVVVEDNAGCTPVSSGLLSTLIPDELVVLSFTSNDIACYGNADGVIEIAAQGGTPLYTYTLYDELDVMSGEIESMADATFTGLTAGTYRVEISDVNGCGPAVAGNIVIDQPAQILVDVLFEDISCFGLSDGLINITASGGDGNLEYSINGGADYYPSANFTGLAANSYDVVVRDGTGCAVDPGIFLLSQPDELLFDVVQVQDIIIGSQNDYGSIMVIMSGGTEPYNYSNDGGLSWQSENLFENLPEGVYDIMVNDANNCQADTTVAIQEVTGITASVSTTMPSCHGYDDAMISITADLGTEPYSYSIDGGVSFETSGNFTGLGAGIYDIVVEDAAGLLYLETVVMDEPDPVIATYMVNSAMCNNFSSDGAVELNVTGGTGSYSFNWSNGGTTKDMIDLEAGDYEVVITDGNSCETSEIIQVGYDHLVEVSLNGDLTICHGESVQLEPVLQNSGSSLVYEWTASEGTDPQSVASPNVSPVSATLYSLRVTDENSCYDEASILVDVHPLQGINIGNDTVIYQGTAIELEVSGGDFISYEWAPPTGLSELSGPVTTATVTDDIRYYVYAETAEGCTEYDSISIGIVKPVDPVSGFTPNNDGVNDFFDIPNAGDYPDIVVEIYNRAGQRVFRSEGYTDDKRWDGKFNGKDLPVGTYYFVITLNDVFGTRPVTGPVTIVR